MRFKRVVALFFTMGMVLAVTAYGQGIDSTRAAAERGDPAAQMAMGAFCRHGMGVPQSDTEAARWYLLAANQGDAGAQTTVGMLYLSGQGVPQDDVQAKAWLRKAAKQGDTTAQRQLESLKKPVEE
ncbi:MAG: sel1 repeat family protein [Magnetococcales bacterium]|nr:sel1 repeat family protein [Magnetococcales bacterium]